MAEESSVIVLSSPPKATKRPPNTHRPSISDDSSDLESIPGPRRPGRKSPFSDAQTAYLDKEYRQLWIAFFTKNNAPKDRAKCTEWKTRSAKAILKSENFKGKLDNSKSTVEWRDVSDYHWVL